MSEQPNQIHQTRLQRLCRVCGGSLKHSRTVYECKNHKDDLMAVFHVDINFDTPAVHPRQLCEKCKTILSKSMKTTTEGEVYGHRVKVHEWHQHNSDSCSVCTLPVGGRPKLTKNRGRPAATSTHALINNIRQCSPPSLLPVAMKNSRPSYTLYPTLGLAADDVECSICKLLLDQPVQLSCGSVVCTECVCRLVHCTGIFFNISIKP